MAVKLEPNRLIVRNIFRSIDSKISHQNLNEVCPGLHYRPNGNWSVASRIYVLLTLEANKSLSRTRLTFLNMPRFTSCSTPHSIDSAINAWDLHSCLSLLITGTTSKSTHYSEIDINIVRQEQIWLLWFNKQINTLSMQKPVTMPG